MAIPTVIQTNRLLPINHIIVPRHGMIDEMNVGMTTPTPPTTRNIRSIAGMMTKMTPAIIEQIIMISQSRNPKTIHAIPTANPTHGISPRHKANPSIAKNPNTTIGTVRHGTMIRMRPISTSSIIKHPIIQQPIRKQPIRQQPIDITNNTHAHINPKHGINAIIHAHMLNNT
jgi:hypothetical protein